MYLCSPSDSSLLVRFQKLRECKKKCYITLFSGTDKLKMEEQIAVNNINIMQVSTATTCKVKLKTNTLPQTANQLLIKFHKLYHTGLLF